MAKLKLKGSSAEIKEVLNGDTAAGPAKISGGKTPMKPYPATMQSEGNNKTEENDDAGVTLKVKPTTTRPGTPEGKVEQGFDVVNKVAREFRPDGPEAARKKNNMARDARTNLGRSTWSTPVLE